MPETLLAGGSRSHRPRLLPRKKLLVWLVLPTVLAVAATVVLVRITRDKPRYGAQAELIAELRGLVGENGLFMRPGLSSEGAPSWPDSAYGLGALAAAGAHLPPPADPAAAGTSLQAEVAADPIWSRWYGAQVERSTGVPIPGSWANGLLDKLRSEEHTSELQSQSNLVCRLLLEKKKTQCWCGNGRIRLHTQNRSR